MNFKYTPIEYDAAHLECYASLLQLVFPKTNKFTKSFLQWLYVDNPNGFVFGYNAWVNDELVGHYATIPVIYSINNKPVKGLLSLNTAVHPEYRGHRLFTTLAQKTYENAIFNNYKFVIGVANENSSPGFLKHLGFYLVSPLDVKIGLGDITPFKRHDTTVYAIWNHTLLQWRTIALKAHYTKFKNSLYHLVYKGLIKVKLTHNSKLPDYFDNKRNPAFTMWIGIASHKDQNGWFFNLPEALKPSPLHLIFKDLTNGTLPKLTRNNTYFELIDFDAY